MRGTMPAMSHTTRISKRSPFSLNDHNQTEIDYRTRDKHSGKLSVKGDQKNRRMYEWKQASEKYFTKRNERGTDSHPEPQATTHE